MHALGPSNWVSYPGGGGGGGTPYITKKLCAPPRGMVWRRFGLKTGIDFAHFGPESGMVYKGTR